MLGAAAVLAPNVVLPWLGAVGARHPLALLLVASGESPLITSMYPLAPWFGMCALGAGFGRLLRRNAERTLSAALPAGVLLVALFAAVRAGGGFGNLRLAEGAGWMGWLTVVKYPPSLAFTSLTLGLDLLLLWLLHRGRQRLGAGLRVLVSYGQAPLFFYIAHFYLFGLLSITAFRGQAAAQWMLYPLWLAGVAALLPACRWFGAFKQRQPEASLWRML